MTPMSSLNSSEDGGRLVAECLQWEAGGVGVPCRWRAGGALGMEVSLLTGDCSNVGITYTYIYVVIYSFRYIRFSPFSLLRIILVHAKFSNIQFDANKSTLTF